MALWMEPGQEPVTETQRADLDAIEAIRESAALELKEEGNEFLKRGRKFYADAVDCYTRAINQRCADERTNSVLFANRAQVNLLLGNFRRAVSDAEEAIKRNPANVKAYFRGAKAALELELFSEAGRFCTEGLSLEPSSQELIKIKDQVDKKVAEVTEKRRRALQAQSKTEAIVSALSARKVKLGNALYRERSQGKTPWLDSRRILHWPVLLLYGEVMSSDFIEDFCETDTFAVHLDEMFGENAPPLVWDDRHEYTRHRIALYYRANASVPLSRKRTVELLSANEAGYCRASAEDEETEDDDVIGKYRQHSMHANMGEPCWVKVNQSETLSSILSKDNHILPGIPVFYVVATGTRFFYTFTSGQWCPP